MIAQKQYKYDGFRADVIQVNNVTYFPQGFSPRFCSCVRETRNYGFLCVVM